MNVTLAFFVTAQFDSMKYRPSSQEMRVLVAVPLSALVCCCPYVSYDTVKSKYVSPSIVYNLWNVLA